MEMIQIIQGTVLAIDQTRGNRIRCFHGSCSHLLQLLLQLLHLLLLVVLMLTLMVLWASLRPQRKGCSCAAHCKAVTSSEGLH